MAVPAPGQGRRTAKAIADLELGEDEARALIAAMASISDFKGDFGVIWRLPARDPRYERIVDRALASIGEEAILHVLESDE